MIHASMNTLKRRLIKFFDWQIHDRLLGHRWPSCEWVLFHPWWGSDDDTEGASQWTDTRI